MKKVIKWTNKMSGETGYVKKVSKTYGHFVNTWEKSEAKIYQTDKQITKDMEILDEIGETVNNNFESVEI